MNSTDTASDPKKRRQFFVLVAIALATLGVWKVLHGKITPAPYLFSVSLLFLLLEFVFTSLATSFFKVWMSFAHILGIINTKIILTVIYFLFLTPLGLLKGVFAKSPYSLEAYRKQKSAWVPLQASTEENHYKNPY